MGAPLAILGVTGADGAALEAVGFPDANVAVAAGAAIGDTGARAAAAIAVSANRDQAVVSVNGVERARTGRGAAVVLVDPRGRVEAYNLDASGRLRVPFDMNIMPLFRVTGAVSCVDVGNAGWRDISALATRQLAVRIDNYRAFQSTLVLFVVGDAPATPRLTEVSGSGVPRMSVRTFRLADAGDRDKLRLTAIADCLEAVPATDAALFVSRIELEVNDQGDHRAMRLDLDVVPRHAFVRAAVDLNNPKRATVCGVSAGL